VEITTFRTEGNYQDHRRPDWVEFVTDIKQDLARRDFTVNAMAWSPERGLCDPFGGQQDLKDHILRAVGDPWRRFEEDSLRILRGVRFGVRFRLTPEEKTLSAMKEMAPLMDNLARERVFEELCKLLPLVTAEDLLLYRDILAQVIPELKATFGFDQKNHHHAYDLYTHIAHVTAKTPPVAELRFAALLHDLGKVSTFTVDEAGEGHFYGHAGESAKLAERILRQLKAPTAFRERVVLLVQRHMDTLEPDRKLLLRRLRKYGQEAVEQLLALQRADYGSKGADKQEDPFSETEMLLRQILSETPCLGLKDLAVNGRDLRELGYPEGPQMGVALQYLLEQVGEEKLPNDREILLSAARRYLNEQNT
jgi:tRNA nucleotidyltransferase (CCA-adding enzyme)